MDTSRFFIEGDSDRPWAHAVRAALIQQEGSFEPTDQASRDRLLDAIRHEGYPEAQMVYEEGVAGGLPTIRVRPRPAPLAGGR